LTEPLIITRSERDDHQLDFTIQLGPERTESALQRGARQIARRARIPGFRPGKAPYAAVLRMFGREAVLRQALDDLGQEILREALDAEKIETYGPAELADLQFDPVAFKLVLPLRPTVDLGDYRAIRVAAPDATVTEADVDALIERARSEQAVWQATDRPAEIGDTVVMDIHGTVGEETLMDNQDWELLLKAEGGWLPGFDEAFVGATAGEEKAFSLTYPEDSASRFKGQTASFRAAIKQVRTRAMPELDDEYARTLGDYQDLADLRARLLASLTQQRTAEAEERLTNAAIQAMVEKATIAYPPLAIKEMTDELVSDLESQVKSSGRSLEEYLRLQGLTVEVYRTRIQPLAEQRLKTRLALFEFADREGLTVEQDEIAAGADQAVAAAADQADATRQYLGSDAGRRALASELLTRKTLARLRAIVTGQVAEAEAPAAADTDEAASRESEGTGAPVVETTEALTPAAEDAEAPTPAAEDAEAPTPAAEDAEAPIPAAEDAEVPVPAAEPAALSKGTQL